MNHRVGSRRQSALGGWAALAVVGVVWMAAPATVRAQGGGWSLKKDPCNATLLARYFSMLERNPNDRFPMKKLRKCRSAESLIRRYKAKVKRRPSWYEGHVILGHLFVSTKKLKKAVKAYKKAITLNSKAANPQLSLGHLLRKLKKPAEALKFYEKAFALSKSKRLKKKVLRSLIELSMMQKKMKKARRYFKKLLALEPKNKHLRGEFARMLARNLKFKLALKEYRVLLKQARGNNKRRGALLKEMGQVYEKMGKDPEAIETYRRAMKLTTRRHWLRRELVEKVIAIYRRKGDIKSLAAHYEKNWRSKGLFEWQTLAQLYDELGQQAKAVKAYKRALAIRSSAVDTRDKLISLLERAGRHREALTELEKQVRLAPGEPRYLLRLAKKYWKARKRKKSIALLKRCGRRFPRDGSVHVALADLYTKWGQPNLAMEQYRVLVRIEPNDPGHVISLGEQYWQRGKKSRALSTWKSLLRPGMFSTRQEAYATLGSVYAEHEMLAKGIQMYKKALRLAPKNPAIYRALAPVYKRARQYDKAVDAWQKVIKLATEPSKRGWRREARTSIISLWHSQKKLKGKLASYKKRFRASKPDLEAGYFLGEAYIKLKKLDTAEKVFKDILKVDAQQHEALLALAEIYRKEHKLNKAIDVMKRLAVVLPNRAREFYMRIAELALVAYRDELALSYVKKALKMSKGDAYGWARIARIYEKKEDYAAAIKAFKKALEIRPRYFKVHFDLAKIYLRQGQHLQASELYHSVVQRSPEEHLVSKAGALAVDLDEYLGRLDGFERELIPLAFTYTHKPVYRKLLVKVYSRMIPALVRKKRYAASVSERESAKRKLKDIGSRALKPLLESLSSDSHKNKLMAVDLLGYLGNPGAAPTLVRLALNPPEDEDSSLGFLHSGASRSVAPPSKFRRRRRRHRRRRIKPKKVNREDKRKLKFKVRALVAAGRLSNPRTVKDLVKLLKADEVAVRETAAWALALIATPATRKALLGALKDRKIGVQSMACLGLGFMGSRNLETLVKMVKDRRRREEVRAACAFAVGLTKDRRGVPSLLEVMGRGRSPVQHKAALGLGLLGDPKAVDSLLKLVWTRRGKNLEATRWAVLRSAMGKRVSMDLSALREVELDGEGRLPVLEMIKKLGPSTYKIAEKTRKKLVKRHTEALKIGLRDALSRHRDVLIRVLESLDAHPEGFSLGALDPRYVQRSVAGREAKRGGLSAKRKAPRVAAVGRALSGSFLRLCSHRDTDVRAKALSLLVKVRAGEAVGRLEKALGDKRSTVRKMAVQSAVLWVEKKPSSRRRVAKMLMKRFDKLHWEERSAVLMALGRFKAASAVPFLISKMKSDNGFEAQAAVAALGVMRPAAAQRPLVAAVGEAIEPVRLAAVRALAGYGAAAVKRALRRAAASDLSPRVRRAARKALE